MSAPSVEPTACIETDEATGVQVTVVGPEGKQIEIQPKSPIDSSAVTLGPDSDAQATPPSKNAEIRAQACAQRPSATDLEFKSEFPPTLFFPPGSERVAVSRLLLLYNPVSGNGSGEKRALEAERLLSERGVSVTKRQLEKPGHAKEIAQQEDLSRFDALAVVGGDGTLHEAINGLHSRADQRSLPLAVIAGGTGNSFAREFLGDSLSDVATAVEHVCRGLVVPVDLMRLSFLEGCEPVFSFNSLHWGLASQVVLTAEKLRWMGKAVRYTTAALVELLRGSSSVARVTMENEDGTRSVVEGEFCLIVCNNVFSTARNMKLVPHAKVNDGLVDLLLVSSDAAVDLFKVFLHIFSGSHAELPFVHYHQCRGFTIETMTELSDSEDAAPSANSASRAPTASASESMSGPRSAKEEGAAKAPANTPAVAKEGEAVVDTERRVKGRPKRDPERDEPLQEVLDVDGELMTGVFTQIHCQLLPRALRVII